MQESLNHGQLQSCQTKCYFIWYGPTSETKIDFNRRKWFLQFRNKPSHSQAGERCFDFTPLFATGLFASNSALLLFPILPAFLSLAIMVSHSFHLQCILVYRSKAVKYIHGTEQ